MRPFPRTREFNTLTSKPQTPNLQEREDLQLADHSSEIFFKSQVHYPIPRPGYEYPDETTGSDDDEGGDDDGAPTYRWIGEQPQLESSISSDESQEDEGRGEDDAAGKPSLNMPMDVN